MTVAVQIAAQTRQQFGDATKVGKGPDIVVGAHDWLGELVQNGTVAPIQLDAATTAKFAPAAVAASKFNGQNYGVPFSVENIALVRNTDMVPDAPATLDDLLKAAKAAQAKDSKITTLLDQSVGKTGNAYYTYPWLSAYGGGIFGTTASGDYDPAKVIVNSAESLKGAEQLAAMGKQKVLSTNVGDDNSEALFTGGKAPFFITGPWSIPNVKKAGIKYGISSLPALTGGDAMQPFLGVQLFYVSAKAKNAALAQDFVTQYVPTKDFQLAIFQAGGRPAGPDRGLRRGRRGGPGRQGVVRGRQGRQAHAEYPRHELGLGPAGSGRVRRHRRQGRGQGTLRRGAEGDRQGDRGELIPENAADR